MGFLIGLLMLALFLVCVLMSLIILFQDNKAGVLAGDRREKPAYGAYRDWIRAH